MVVRCTLRGALRARELVITMMDDDDCSNCLLNPCNVVAQLVTSQPDAVDLTLTCFSHTDVLGPSRIARKQLASSTVHSAHLHVLRGFPLLHGSGAGYPGIAILIYSWHCGIGILSGDGICSRS